MNESLSGDYGSLSILELSKRKRIKYHLLNRSWRDESEIYQLWSTLDSIEDAQRAFTEISCVLKERIQFQFGIHKYYNYKMGDHRGFIQRLIRNQLELKTQDLSVDPLHAAQSLQIMQCHKKQIYG